MQKAFVPSVLRWDPQHGPEDLPVGQQNENENNPPKTRKALKARSPRGLREEREQESPRIWGVSQKDGLRALPWQIRSENVLTACSRARRNPLPWAAAAVQTQALLPRRVP